MILRFTSSLSFRASIATVRDALTDPSMMQKVAWPLVRFSPSRPAVFPIRWVQGETYRMNMYGLGVLPLGWQELLISSEELPGGSFVLRDVGPGFAVSLWDHEVWISVRKEGGTTYEEKLTLTAGVMAPVLLVSMRILFWWRERRWHTLLM